VSRSKTSYLAILLICSIFFIPSARAETEFKMNGAACPDGTISLEKVDPVTMESTTVCSDPYNIGNTNSDSSASLDESFSSLTNTSQRCPGGGIQRIMFNEYTMQYEMRCDDESAGVLDLISESYRDSSDCILRTNPFDMKAVNKCYTDLSSTGASTVVKMTDDEAAEMDYSDENAAAFTAGGLSY
jgi:hypothetical protein